MKTWSTIAICHDRMAHESFHFLLHGLESQKAVSAQKYNRGRTTNPFPTTVRSNQIYANIGGNNIASPLTMQGYICFSSRYGIMSERPERKRSWHWRCGGKKLRLNRDSETEHRRFCTVSKPKFVSSFKVALNRCALYSQKEYTVHLKQFILTQLKHSEQYDFLLVGKIFTDKNNAIAMYTFK